MLIRNASNRFERSYKPLTSGGTRGGVSLTKITPKARRVVGPAMR